MQVEGLLNKFIPAHVHRHDDIHVVIGRRQEDDRHLRYLPDLLAPVESVEEREHDIQKDKLRIILFKFLYNILEILYTSCVIIPFAQMRS